MATTKRNQRKRAEAARKPDAGASISGLAAAEAAKHLERSQISKYHTKGGHGFSAEDANAFSDKVRLRKVEVTGTSNEAHGPDRIVAGVKIQTKYYETPKGTVDAVKRDALKILSFKVNKK